ncbi:hypothetical protein ACHAW6_002999, partial [Cyclotella cf. meneghiniana]
MTPPPPLKLSVLYYKRSNKVHKHRGTTKEDGILTIRPPPSCLVTLTSCCDDEEDRESSCDGLGDDDDDDGGGGGAKKRKWNALRKSTKTKNDRSKSVVVYSGVNNEIARKAFGDNGVGDNGSHEATEDDVLVLNGQWECQVVADSNGAKGLKPASSKPLTASMATNSGGGPSLKRVVVRAPLKSLRKNPTENRRQTSILSKSNKPTLLSVGAASSLKRIPPSSSTGALGKMTKDANGESHLDKEEVQYDKEDDDNDETDKPALIHKIPARLLSHKRTRTLPRPTAVRSNETRHVANNAGIDEFQGANGIQVPASVRDVLRPHQREGIVFLWNCVTGANEGLRRIFERRRSTEDDGYEEDNHRANTVEVPRGAVLADEMGLGKVVGAVEISRPFIRFSSTLMTIATIYSLHRHRRDRRFIVVCPSSLVSNWAKEFDKWIGKASQPKRVIVRNGAKEEGLRNLKSFVPVKPQHAEVLILSYELLRLHAARIGLLVVDEGHRLKNTAGSQTLSALNSLHAEARILISGTPVQNNLSEFYSVANFAVPGILGDLSGFRRWYERPLSEANSKNATREQKERGRVQSKALEEITSTFVLRRLQRDVLKSILPPRMELLLFCRPSDKQCELYREISRRASIGGREEDDNPLMLLTELRKLCTHPSLLNKEEEPSSLSLSGKDVSLSGKLVVLESLLDSIREHHPDDKVVIISNFTTALSLIESCILRKKKLPFVRLDGSVELSARQSIVDSFNNASVNHSFAFLLSSKAGGCGLNLIGANRLVMVDADWNPATDQQAMARVYRQGQTKQCYIYRMFTTGTVEEVIFQRQTQKGNLALLANDGGHPSKGRSQKCASFTPEELRDC